MTENDRFYIERCLDGHPDDFHHLVRRYQSALIAGLTYRLKDRDRAEETAQETFIRTSCGDGPNAVNLTRNTDPSGL